jgi:hypothetical protein
MKRLGRLSVWALLLGACGAGTTVSSTPPSYPSFQPGYGATGGYAMPGVVPAATTFWAALDQPISAAQTQPGQPFSATVSSDIVGPGGVMIPRGARVFGHVADVRYAAGNSPNAVVLSLDGIDVNGQRMPVAASLVQTSLTPQSQVGSISGRDVLIGTAIGAVLGGVTKGGEGALVGGALGAGGGALVSLGMNREQGVLPPGTQLQLRLEQPLQLAPVAQPYQAPAYQQPVEQPPPAYAPPPSYNQQPYAPPPPSYDNPPPDYNAPPTY